MLLWSFVELLRPLQPMITNDESVVPLGRWLMFSFHEEDKDEIKVCVRILPICLGHGVHPSWMGEHSKYCKSISSVFCAMGHAKTVATIDFSS